MKMVEPVKVLFVCMGNICRSPTAEAVFTKLVSEHGYEKRIEIDSAGTHAYHVGNSPDARAMETAQTHGMDMHQQRARQVVKSDLQTFDYVLAMDRDNLNRLEQMQPRGSHKARLGLLLSYAKGASVSEVPDPYYGGPGGFERVFDLVESGCRGLLEDIEQRFTL